MTIPGVPVPLRRKTAEVLRYARAERPALDYLRFSFTPESGRAFLARRFELSEARTWTGRKVLTALMTPLAIALGHDLDPSGLDLRLYGRSDSELRALLEEQGASLDLFHEALRDAFRRGLIYRVYSREDSKTYYGVPLVVRAAFSLKPVLKDLSQMKPFQRAAGKAFPKFKDT